MSLRALSARVARLEPIPVVRRVPNVIEVRFGETVDDAFARLLDEFGAIPAHHAFMVVPEQPTDPGEMAAVDKFVEERQAALIAYVRTPPEEQMH